MNLTASELKTLILNRVKLSSTDLKDVADSFSKLYCDFQDDVIDRVAVEPVPATPYTWIDPPTGRSRGVLLFFHGGGYTMGSTLDHLQLVASLVDQSGVSVLGIDYRLCPEHQFPAALDDGEEAYRWLLSNHPFPKAIGVSGISAGALLATQLIYRCQETNHPLPTLAVIMSGPRDLDFNSASCSYNIDRDFVGPERLRNIRHYYLPEKVDRDSAVLYPAKQIYQSYPRTLFQAGDHEVLLDDSIDFYQRLRTQGHDVSLQVIPGLLHCGQMFSHVFPAGQVAIEQAARFIRDGLSIEQPQ